MSCFCPANENVSANIGIVGRNGGGGFLRIFSYCLQVGIQQFNSVAIAALGAEILEFKGNPALGEGKNLSTLFPFTLINIRRNDGPAVILRFLGNGGVGNAPNIFPCFQESASSGDGDFPGNISRRSL